MASGERVLITGINGFVGSYLAEFYLKKGYEVHGIMRQRSDLINIRHIKDKLTLHYSDVRDAHSLTALLKNDFDYIHHLAAISYVPYSWINPAETIETNGVGTINLLEAVRESNSDPTVQICGSSEEYGFVKEDELPIKETNQLRPISPYGVSKVLQDLLGWQYHKSYGLKIVRTRAFNHTGPRRGEFFVTSNFCKQVSEIEKGLKEPMIYVGNLDAQRDFTDVRDVIKAYWLAVNKCEFGEVYNICSEKVRSIKSVLDLILSLTDKKIKIKQDTNRVRPSDVEILQGDCSKFKKRTGWKAEIPFEKTMSDLLNHWREKI